MVNRNEWSTPDYIFETLHATYRFTIDACATYENAKISRYWDLEHDGLKQDWFNERVWCNPPYGRGLIQPWIDKACQSSNYSAVFLLPSRTDTKWFQILWNQMRRGCATITFWPKRIHFIPPPGVKASSPTEASIVVRIWA